jgi:hypothetical protein
MAVETSSALTGLEPRSFWGHFDALTRIARPSRAEEPVIEHVSTWAGEHGFEVVQDSGRNLVVRVPGSQGRESAQTVTLQGHLDMVCERDPSSPNDPAEGRIALVRDGEWLKADGTTLGADDGVAIAAMMALVEDESLSHGPLELLMTVAEEVGLEGANALDPALVSTDTRKWLASVAPRQLVPSRANVEVDSGLTRAFAGWRTDASHLRGGDALAAMSYESCSWTVQSRMPPKTIRPEPTATSTTLSSPSPTRFRVSATSVEKPPYQVSVPRPTPTRSSAAAEADRLHRVRPLETTPSRARSSVG